MGQLKIRFSEQIDTPGPTASLLIIFPIVFHTRSWWGRLVTFNDLHYHGPVLNHSTSCFSRTSWTLAASTGLCPKAMLANAFSPQRITFRGIFAAKFAFLGGASRHCDWLQTSLSWPIFLQQNTFLRCLFPLSLLWNWCTYPDLQMQCVSLFAVCWKGKTLSSLMTVGMKMAWKTV